MQRKAPSRPFQLTVAAVLIGGAPVAAALGYLALSKNPDVVINEVVPEVVGFWVLCGVFIYLSQHAARKVALVAAVTEVIVVLLVSLFVNDQLLAILSAVCILHAFALLLLYRSPAKRWLDGTSPDAQGETTPPVVERAPTKPRPRRRPVTLQERIVCYVLFAAFTAGIVAGIRFGDGLAIFSGVLLIALPIWVLAIFCGFASFALPWRIHAKLIAAAAAIATGPMAVMIAIAMAP
jgi:hypothetical protein